MKKDLRGVTLIELLVVVAIITILALIAYASLSGARAEAKKATVRASMDSLRPAAEIYILTHNYEYTGFCSEAAVTTVENACKNVYTDCSCSCTAGADTWSVTCSSTGGSFSWTCDEDSCQE